MGREELMKCFQDTLEFSESEIMKERTEVSRKLSIVYQEGYVSTVKKKEEQCDILVEANTSFAEARKHIGIGKIAVLNFANPENPGGGVQNGAVAQEECLCRSSNLYPCLIDEKVQNEYYLYHRNLKNRFYSDRLIYTKSVTVFKTDDIVPQMMPENEWFDVGIITCAAPYLAKRKYTNLTALKLLFKSRIKNIFEAAKDNNVDILILGAFGCGAFKNPPKIVAEAFQEIIHEENYKQNFKKIIFAIKPSGEHCENLSVFSSQFDSDAPDADSRCVLLCESPEWRFYSIPKFTNGMKLKDNREFHQWQGDNPYFAKQFSILGDSISTLDGYNPRGYNFFYSDENCSKTGVCDMADTWWGKAIDFFGGELLVNNSWSGSRVTQLPNSDILFPSGCSDERTNGLHINTVSPDVVIVYLGTNDWARGAEPDQARKGFCDDKTGVFVDGYIDDLHCFECAYSEMIRKVKSNYPDAEIWCCTLNETFMSSNPNFKFPHNYGGKHIDQFNTVIKKVASQNQSKLIDFDGFHWAYDSIDGSHPTSNGMDTLAMMAIRQIGGKDIESFLDCEGDQHSYEAVDEYTGGTQYTCKKCGKIKHNSFLSEFEHEEQEKKDMGGEYVMVDPDITTILYSDTIRLSVESTGETFRIQKPIVRVGRDAGCELKFNPSHKYIARIQASFLFERNIWFVRDENSTNGTWLNGQKLKPGVKYQLNADDVIDFAHSEKIIFEKTKNKDNESNGDADGKAIAFLEAGMKAFAKADHKDEVAFKIVVSALLDAPLYFPVEIDIEAMFGNADPTKLKKGDTIQPKKDVRMKILTLTLADGSEIVPMFTSKDEVNKGQSVSVVRYYPCDYLPMLIKMQKSVIVNPFSDEKFIMSKELIKDLLYPLVMDKSNQKQTAASCTYQDEMIGTVVDGKYEILREIGRGGLSRIFLALDKRLNKTWAIKSYNKTSPIYNSAIHDAVMQETRMLMKLDHPGIPRIVDLIENEQYLYIVREYIEGETLDYIVKSYGAQPVDKVIEWAKQLCCILNYLHTLTPPHIHRDMKPANIILMPNGQVKLIDFGIMRLYDPNKSTDTCALGTRGYAAPEQYGGVVQTDARTDIFGLGMTMYNLLTGLNPDEPPYEIKPIRQVNPSLSKSLEKIICKCIEPNPEKRYQSTDELLRFLSDENGTKLSKGLFGKLFGKTK